MLARRTFASGPALLQAPRRWHARQTVHRVFKADTAVCTLSPMGKDRTFRARRPSHFSALMSIFPPLASGLLYYFPPQHTGTRLMKSTNLKKTQRASHYSLGDLIMAVSTYSKNNGETVAA